MSYISEQAFPPYQIDIFFSEFWLGVEVDGPHHKYNKKADGSRDAYLLEYYGVKVRRLDVTKRPKKERVLTEITAFIEEAADTADERRKLWARHSSGFNPGTWGILEPYAG